MSRTRLSRATILAAPLLLLAGAALAAPSVPEGAFGSGAADRHEDPTVEARLLVDASVVRPGDRLRVGVLFELDRGWHLYWRNPGETGFPTRLEWDVAGARVGPILWPAPQVFREEEDTITTYGYADSVLLQNEAVVADAPGHHLQLAVTADFLVCRIQCIPGRIELRRSVPVQDRPEPAERATRVLFERWAARVPVSAASLGLDVDALYSQSAIRPGDAFRAAISLVCESETDTAPCRSLRPVDPISDSFAADALPSLQLEVTGARAHPFSPGLLVTLAGRAGEELPQGDEPLRGVVQVRNDAGDWLALEVELPLPRASADVQPVALDNPWLEPDPDLVRSAGVSLWQALLLAWVGGLILNLMPCVLPVLAIKVFGIAERAHEARRSVWMHGAAYTLGILATMVALAAVVIALRAAGGAVGWGFQFQEPLFVASIAALLLVFALNLFGVFEVALPGAGRLDRLPPTTGPRGSFFEGTLAVLLATPCSAPFLGTAVGFAFASSAPVILAIFVAIGLGLAAPFIAVTLVPGWARLLPKSGPWMTQLRAVLGFALLGTLVWLLWVVGRSAGSDGMSLLLAFLVALALGVWIYGLRQRANDDGRAPLAALAVGAFAVTGLFWLPLEPVSRAQATELAEHGIDAAPFDPAAIRSELDAGRPVFVYFTADWCLTCKVNEHAVLRDTRVAEALEHRDVTSFEADWTLRDETIRAELARHGRAGVPLYLLYDPRRPARPAVLPELLTVDLVLDALEGVGA